MAVTLDQIYDAAGADHNVDPDWLRAIAQVETHNRQTDAQGRVITSPTGVQGRMQMTLDTARKYGVTDRLDDTQTIPAAAQLLSEALDRTGSDPMKALLSYNNTDPQYGAKVVGALRQIKAQRAQPARQAGVNHQDEQFPPDSAPATAPAAVPDHAALEQELLGEGASTGPTAEDHKALEDELLSGSTPPPASSPPPAGSPAPAASQEAPQPLLDRVGAGVQQGFLDVAGTAAKGIANAGQWVDDRVPALASLDQWAGMDNAGTAGRVNALADAYQRQYGGDTAADVGRIGGQMVASAPAMGGANIGAGLAGRALLGNTGAKFMTGQLGGNMLARTGSLAAQGATLGAAAEASVGGDPAKGAVQGAVMGPVTGAAFGALRGIGNRLAGNVPASLSVPDAQLADTAVNKWKIPLRLDQLSNTGAVRMAGDAVNRLPFSGGTEFTGQQLSAFNRAVASTIGESADALTPDVMTKARTRIGAMFDNVESKMSVPVANDPALINQLGQIETDAGKVMTREQAEIIKNQITDVLDKAAAGNGTLDGAAFRNFVKRDTPLDRVANSNDPNVSHYAGEIQDALRDAMERSLPPGSPVLAEYQAARQQYRNLKTIDKLVAKAPTGDVPPAQLMARAVANDPQMAYTGGGDLGELARIGQRFLKVPANSGTPERTMALQGLMAAGRIAPTALGIGAGYAAGDLAGAGLAAGGAAALGPVIGDVLRDPARVNRLIQKGLVQKPIVANRNTLVDQLQPYLAGSSVLAIPAAR